MGSNSHDVPLPLWADESQEAAQVVPAEVPSAKRRRAQRLWSIEEVAEYLGVPKQTVYLSATLEDEADPTLENEATGS